MAGVLRYLALWMARLSGLVYRCVRHRLVANLLILAAIGGGLWTADELIARWAPERVAVGEPVPAEPESTTAPSTGLAAPTPEGADRAGADTADAGSDPESPAPQAAEPSAEPPTAAARPGWLTLWNVLSIYALGLLVWWVLKARGRLVIGEFDDLTGGEAGGLAKGLAALIAVELSQLSELFNEFDVGRVLQATPEKLQPVDATVQSEGTAPILEQAVTAESEFALGPFRIPVGIIVGLVGRLARGPRMTGQVHCEGDQRIITVELIGGAHHMCWEMPERATSDEAGERTWREAGDVVEELGVRIFAGLAMGGTVHWRALRHFVSGLRAYRLSLRTSKDRKLNRQRAERSLVQAIAEDARFDLAYYNLGVVYTELRRHDAAGVAFTKAIGLNNRRWSSYYALAQSSFHAGSTRAPLAAAIHFYKAIDHCERAVRLAPRAAVAAQVLNLQALAQLRLGDTELEEASRSCRRAVRRAWQALCLAELGGGPPSTRRLSTLDEARKLASTSLRNLSYVYVTAGRHPGVHRLLRRIALRKARGTLRQARYLTPWVVDIYLSLGSVYLERKRFGRAVEAYLNAARVDPTSAEAWGFLALAYARLDREDRSLQAANRVLADVSSASESSLQALVEAMVALGQRIGEIESFVSGAKTEYRYRRRPSFFVWFMRGHFRYSYRLAGRRLARAGATGALMTRWLLAPDAALQHLAGVRTRLRETSERVKALSGLRDRVRKLMDQKEQGVDGLEELLKENLRAGSFWEVGEVAHSLARLCFLQRPDKAEEVLTMAIALLEATYPGEIERRGLYALLARSLGAQRKHAEALDKARVAVGRDPVGTYERRQLGWAYFAVGEHGRALTAWSDALLWDPDNAELHYRIGLCHLIRGYGASDRPERSTHFARATGRLETALELFEADEPLRHEVSYHLAMAHFYTGRHTETITLLQVLERAGYKELKVALDLADAYFGNEDWLEAEKRFRKIAGDLEERIRAAEQGVDQPLEVPDGATAMVLGTAAALAHLGVAGSLAEREVRLQEALGEVAKAGAALDGVSDAALKREWMGRCASFAGQILYRQGELDQAIEALEAALADNPAADAYYYLALALAHKIQLGAEQEDTEPLVRRIRDYCEQTQRLDWSGKLDDRVAALRDTLPRSVSGPAGRPGAPPPGS